MNQTIEEVRRIADDWGRNLAPTDLVQNGENAQLMADYCLTQFGVVTASGLSKAYNALRAKLELVPQPKEPTQVEIAAKLEAKMRKDYADSIASKSIEGVQKRDQQKAEADNKAANEKEFKQLNSLIEFEISNYTVGHASGVTDYSRTESGRATLRSVRDRHDRSTIANAKAALSAVRLAKSKL